MEKADGRRSQLPEKLVEQTLRIIAEEGSGAVTLRRVAGSAGVSHNAIYRHYRDQAALLDACRQHVSEELTAALKRSLRGKKLGTKDAICALIEGAIRYYKGHPRYYGFLWDGPNVKLSLTMEEVEGNYAPFEYFRRAYRAYAEEHGVSMEDALRGLLKAWCMVQGAASLLTGATVLNVSSDEYLRTLDGEIFL